MRKATDGERELVVLNWGFVLVQKDKAPKRLTNIRDDKAQSKFWRTSFEQRRCLVPPYGVRVIAFSSVASEFVPALLSVASQNPTATTTRAAIKTAR